MIFATSPIFPLLLLCIVVLGAVILSLMVWALLSFNKLVRNRNRMREAWSGIDVQLKRRHDLVPNLCAAVEGYRDHERSLLEDLVRLRAEAAEAGDSADRATGPEAALSKGIGSVFALAEGYPELRSDENFRQLHASLVEIEDDLQYARRYYNGSVRDLNNLVEGFPSGVIARTGGFRKAGFFEVENASERISPSVKAELEQ